MSPYEEISVQLKLKVVDIAAAEWESVIVDIDWYQALSLFWAFFFGSVLNLSSSSVALENHEV